MRKTYLITGGYGFIGRNLSIFLKKKEPKCRIIKAPKRLNLINSKTTNNFFKNINFKIDYIFHLADVSGNKKWASQNSFYQTFSNIQIHLNVISAWIKFKQKAKFVFVSSLWAYPIGKKFLNEETYWGSPHVLYANFYAFTKKIASLLLKAAKKDYGLKSVTLVLGSTFGPGDKSNHFIPSIIRRIKKKPSKLIINGSGAESRDFIFIDDQIKAIYLHKDVNLEIINIGTGRLTTIKKIVNLLINIMNFKGKVVFKQKNDSDNDEKRGMSVKKANDLKGWPTKYNLMDLKKSLIFTVKEIK